MELMGQAGAEGRGGGKEEMGRLRKEEEMRERRAGGKPRE